MRKCLFGLLFIASLIYTSCEEDQVLPPYTQDLAELVTNAYGEARTLIFDDGRKLPVVNKLGNLTPDSIYRIRAMYVPVENGVQLTAAQTTVSSFPIELDAAGMQTDPVELKSIWGSPRYVNMLVGLKTGGGAQMIGFVYNGIEVSADGVKKQHIVVFHDQIEDPTYYTQDIYLSCPVYQLSTELEHGRDSVEMTIHTFKGITRKSFPY